MVINKPVLEHYQTKHDDDYSEYKPFCFIWNVFPHLGIHKDSKEHKDECNPHKYPTDWR